MHIACMPSIIHISRPFLFPNKPIFCHQEEFEDAFGISENGISYMGGEH